MGLALSKVPSGTSLVESKSVEKLGKHLVQWATKERFPRLIKMLGENLEKFRPDRSLRSKRCLIVTVSGSKTIFDNRWVRITWCRACV